MGIFEYILKGLGPDARRELAKEATRAAVKNVGDTVYEKADRIRRDFADAAAERRSQKERARAETRRREDTVKAETALDDELAALKAKIEGEG